MLSWAVSHHPHPRRLPYAFHPALASDNNPFQIGFALAMFRMLQSKTEYEQEPKSLDYILFTFLSHSTPQS